MFKCCFHCLLFYLNEERWKNSEDFNSSTLSQLSSVVPLIDLTESPDNSDGDEDIIGDHNQSDSQSSSQLLIDCVQKK